MVRPRLGRLAFAAAVLVAFAAPPSRADNTADEAELRFRRGVAAWNARRFEEALSEFFQSNRLVRNRNVLLNIARCYEQLRFFDEAWRYYDEVLGENPPPEDRKAVEESLARLAPRVALLRVESDPPGADVYVGRKDLGSRGTTPRTLALPPGKVTVLLSRAGHRDASRTETLATGTTVTARIALEFIRARVHATGTPARAEVRVDAVDGPPAGTLPAVLQLAPGRHVLHVSAPDFVAAQYPVDAPADGEASVEIRLQPLPAPTGSIVVTANYDRAQLKVDGKEAGLTPTLVPVPVGTHEVEVLRDEMHPYVRSVQVEANERAVVAAELRYAGAATTAASKTETTLDEVPASVTVITREEMRAFGYTTVAEALRGVRGLFLTVGRRYDYLGVRGFSPPGDNNARVLVLCDGHPMNDLFSGQAFVGRENNVDLAEVERIEVVRGPASSLFGSAAFFGVINIVTRSSLGPATVEAGAATGSAGLARGRASVAGRRGDTEALATVAGLRTLDDGIFVGPADEGEAVTRRRIREDAVNVAARARWGGLSLLASLNTRDIDLFWLTDKGAPLAVAYDLATTDKRAFVEGRWQHDLGGGSGLLARAYFDAARYRKTVGHEDRSVDVSLGDADWTGLELRWRSREVLRQRLSAGAELQRQVRILQQTWLTPPDGRAQLGLDDTRAFNVASAWLADELRLSRDWLVNASARADWYFESFGLTVNPRLAVITRAVPGGITKLMGGRSFRAPSAYERFNADPLRDPATGRLTGAYGVSRPSPGLRPETVLTAELEHSQELAADLRLTGSVYVNRIDDLVYTAEDADGKDMSVNATGTVQTQGGELELRWRPAPWTLLAASYWFQHLSPQGLDAEQSRRLRANIPAHSFALRAMLPLQGPLLVAAVEAVYNAPRPQEDDVPAADELRHLSAGLSGELPGGRFRWYAGVRNLLPDPAPQPATLDVPGMQPPGASFVAQVSGSY